MKTKSQTTRNTQAISQRYLAYLYDCIDGDGYDVELNTNEDKARFLWETFNSEYGWAVERYGLYKAVAEWLSGLPSSISIPFYNSDIVELAKKMGSLPEDATEKQEDKILENYWNFMANKIVRIFDTYKLRG